MILLPTRAVALASYQNDKRKIGFGRKGLGDKKTTFAALPFSWNFDNNIETTSKHLYNGNRFSINHFRN